MNDKKENCVELNIYVECEKCSGHEQKDPCEQHDDKKKEKENENCVKINVFVDCGKEKHKYTF